METRGLRERPKCVLPREFIPKIILDMLTSSSADVTRALRGYFSGGFVFVSFRFKAKEILQCCGNVLFDILITSKGDR